MKDEIINMTRITTQGNFDSAGSSSMQDACHIRIELSRMTLLFMSSSSSVDRAPARCSGGHGFDSCRYWGFFFVHACGMLINSSLTTYSPFLRISKYLLRTAFEGRMLRFIAQALSARDQNRRGKRGSATYNPNRENEVSKIFIISLLWVRRVRERFLFNRNGFKYLTHLESKTSQCKSLLKA